MERINSLSTSFLVPLSSTEAISNFGVEPMARTEILGAGQSANNPLNSSLETNTGIFAANFTESGSLNNVSFMDFDASEIGQIASDAGPEIDQQDCVFRPTVENYLMIFTFSIIFCLSVVGNSIVVVVIMQQRSMRSVTNLYLLNLALSDLLLSVVCMPPTLVSSLVYCWVFGDLLCKLLAYLQPVVVTASAYTLAAIALERYYAICRPLHSRVWHTRAHAIIVISLVWLVSVIANLLMLFMYEEQPYNVNGLNCSPKFQPIVHFCYQIYMTVVLLLIPLVTMIILYGNVISTLRSGIRLDKAALEGRDESKEMPLIEGRESIKNRASLKHCNPEKEQLEKSKKRKWAFLQKFAESQKSFDSNSTWKTQATANSTIRTAEQSLRSTHSERTAVVKQRLIRMLIVIVVIFFCCWTPSYIWWLLLTAQDSFGLFNIWNSELNTMITILTYLSSCTNPITYCFLNSKFRNALFLTFGCRKSGLGSTRMQRACRQYSNQQCIAKTQSNGSDKNNNNNDQNRTNKNPNCCLQMLRHTKLAISRSTNGKSTGSPRHGETGINAEMQKPLVFSDI